MPATTTPEPAVTQAPLQAPEPPKPKVAMGISIQANFSDLGLDNETKKNEFKADFAASMEAKVGGNPVTVTDVRPGSVKVDFEVEAKTSGGLAALENSTSSLKNDLASGGVSLTIGGQTLDAPQQTVEIKKVDVTPPVNETYEFDFKVRSDSDEINLSLRKV